jgi:hypothetical protein
VRAGPRALLERPDRLIGLILLGNNFVNILASSVATIIALRLGGEAAIGIAAGILTLVVLIFSEVTPKTLATLHPERLAYPSAYVYGPLLKAPLPLVWLVNLFANGLLRLMGVTPEGGGGNALSREELRTVVSEAGAMIPERSRSMLLGILDLERATVEDIMIPRNEVEGIDIQDDEAEIIQAIRNAGYTRLPLFDGGIDNVIGVLHSRDALHALLDRRLGKDHSVPSRNHPISSPGEPLCTSSSSTSSGGSSGSVWWWTSTVISWADHPGGSAGGDRRGVRHRPIRQHRGDPPRRGRQPHHRLRHRGAGPQPGPALGPPHPGTQDPERPHPRLSGDHPGAGHQPEAHGHPMEIIQTTENSVKTVRIQARPSRKGRHQDPGAHFGSRS